jgi:hypothetical protein
MHRSEHWRKKVCFVILILLFSGVLGGPTGIVPVGAGRLDVKGIWEKDDGSLCISINSDCNWASSGCGGQRDRSCATQVAAEGTEMDITLRGAAGGAENELFVHRKGNNLEGRDKNGGDVTLVLQCSVCPYQ